MVSFNIPKDLSSLLCSILLLASTASSAAIEFPPDYPFYKDFSTEKPACGLWCTTDLSSTDIPTPTVIPDAPPGLFTIKGPHFHSVKPSEPTPRVPNAAITFLHFTDLAITPTASIPSDPPLSTITPAPTLNRRHYNPPDPNDPNCKVIDLWEDPNHDVNEGRYITECKPEYNPNYTKPYSFVDERGSGEIGKEQEKKEKKERKERKKKEKKEKKKKGADDD